MNQFADFLGYAVLTALALLIITGCCLAVAAGVVVFVRWWRR